MYREGTGNVQSREKSKTIVLERERLLIDGGGWIDKIATTSIRWYLFFIFIFLNLCIRVLSMVYKLSPFVAQLQWLDDASNVIQLFMKLEGWRGGVSGKGEASQSGSGSIRCKSKTYIFLGCPRGIFCSANVNGQVYMVELYGPQTVNQGNMFASEMIGDDAELQQRQPLTIVRDRKFRRGLFDICHVLL